jgi:hypothetical protein
MEIRLRSTGEVMYESEFRTRFAQNLPPRPLTQEWLNTYISDPAGDIVFEGPQPVNGTVYQYSMRQGVEQLDDKWYTKYVLGPIFTDTSATEFQPAKTAAENEADYRAMKDAECAKARRDERNRRLAALDWTQGKDIPDSISVTAALVRQGLRDVPTQAGFPWTVTWPDAS